MRKIPTLLALTTVIIVAVMTSAHAQAQERAGAGIVTGTVVDSASYVLPGARVELQPRGQSASADQEGHFAIGNVAPGDYTITVSYVGPDERPAMAADDALTDDDIAAISARLRVSRNG